MLKKHFYKGETVWSRAEIEATRGVSVQKNASEWHGISADKVFLIKHSRRLAC